MVVKESKDSDQLSVGVDVSRVDWGNFDFIFNPTSDNGDMCLARWIKVEILANPNC